MIKIKHLMDAVEPDDGQRIWIEPDGLTLDLREWCRVDQTLSQLGPSIPLRDWFERHPDDYERFRAMYHESLAASPYKPVLMQLSATATDYDYTLLHAGDSPTQNVATAMYEYLAELQPWKGQA